MADFCFNVLNSNNSNYMVRAAFGDGIWRMSVKINIFSFGPSIVGVGGRIVRSGESVWFIWWLLHFCWFTLQPLRITHYLLLPKMTSRFNRSHLLPSFLTYLNSPTIWRQDSLFCVKSLATLVKLTLSCSSWCTWTSCIDALWSTPLCSQSLS